MNTFISLQNLVNGGEGISRESALSYISRGLVGDVIKMTAVRGQPRILSRMNFIKLLFAQRLFGVGLKVGEVSGVLETFETRLQHAASGRGVATLESVLDHTVILEKYKTADFWTGVRETWILGNEVPEAIRNNQLTIVVNLASITLEVDKALAARGCPDPEVESAEAVEAFQSAHRNFESSQVIEPAPEKVANEEPAQSPVVPKVQPKKVEESHLVPTGPPAVELPAAAEDPDLSTEPEVAPVVVTSRPASEEEFTLTE